MPDKLTVTANMPQGAASLLPFLESLPQGLILTGPDGEIVFYNRAQSELDGLDPAEVVGRKLASVCFGGIWPPAGPDDAGLSRPVTVSYQTARGRKVTASVAAAPLWVGSCSAGMLYLVCPQPEAAEAEIPSRRPKKRAGFEHLIGGSPKFKKALDLAHSGANTPSPVLLAGETGTGKEMFAQGIHDSSARAGRPFVPINCAAIPQELLESLLFGTDKGAFTGAADKAGLLEEADGGTLFLDELDSMPLKLQPKLLRAMQDGKIRRIGSPRELRLDLKIISAVSGDPLEAVKGGRLRPDLFYRLGVLIIHLPPLRERIEDLPILADHFIAKHNLRLGQRVAGLGPEVLEAFRAYGWPGNVRELEHIIEATLNAAGGQRLITPDMLPDHFSLLPHLTLDQYASSRPAPTETPGPGGAPPAGLREREQEMITETLAATGGNVAQAARMLGISRQLLVYKMAKHGLERKNFKN